MKYVACDKVPQSRHQGCQLVRTLSQRKQMLAIPVITKDMASQRE